MANILEIIIQAKDQASKELEGVTKTLKQFSNELKVTGAAMTAVGVAGIKMIDDARNVNASLAGTGITLGLSTKEMRDLALAVTDVGFPLKEVTATFDLLARAGVTGADQLKTTAKAFDSLGDAVGSSAEEVASALIPAFKVFGLALPSSAEELDRFTWMTKNTTVELSDFADAMNYVAREGSGLGVTMNDMISIMAILESRGITGTAATMTFRRAVTEAVSSGRSLNDVLKISADELTTFNEKVGTEAVGATKKYSDAANTQYGIIDKLKQKFSEISLAVGSLLEPLEPLLGVMTALGPVMIFLSTTTGMATIKFIAHTIAVVAHTVALIATRVAIAAATAAQWLWNAAVSANPLGLLVLAIGAVVSALIVFARRTHTTRTEAEKEFIGLANKAKEQFELIALSGKTMTDDLKTGILDAIDPMFDDIIAKLESRKADFIAAFVGMFSETLTMSNDEIAARVATITQGFDDEIATVKQGKARISEIYATAATANRKLTDAENAEILGIWRSMYAEGVAITSEGARSIETIQARLADTSTGISASMYSALKIQSATATMQIIEDANTKYNTLAELAQRNVGILPGYTQQIADLDIANAQRERNESIRLAREQNTELQKTLNDRVGIWTSFLGTLGATFASWKWWDYLALAFPPAGIIGIAKGGETPSFQYGGTVPGPIGQPVPIIAHGGEQFLGVQNIARQPSSGEVHIHVGYLMGDEVSLSRFAKIVKQYIGQDDRRNSFSQVNRDFPRSHI